MTWTFGAEHEWADIDRKRPLPKGYGWDDRDITIVNSNGIANDPKGVLYQFGGEINTPPTKSPEGQVECLNTLKGLFPEAKVNYRSNLHVHVRVPGLKDDLKALKQVQKYIHEYMPRIFPVIEPLPKPTMWEYSNPVELEGASRRWRRRRVSHQALLTRERLAHQLAATTVQEFFDREPPSKDGKPLWHLQPRLCVSLRQMLQTDTTEFRHFPGTLDENELGACVWWCDRFMSAALENGPVQSLLDWAARRKFPSFPPYVHDMEVKYRATVHDGTVPRDKIKKNIVAILAGRFEG